MTGRAGQQGPRRGRLPQVAPSEYVQERHQWDKTEDPPRQFPAQLQVRPVGGEIDPHQDHGEGMQKTDQDLKKLLHSLKLPGRRGSSRAGQPFVPCRPSGASPGDASCVQRNPCPACCPGDAVVKDRETTEPSVLCAERSLDPLAARRPHLELCIRWMQEVRRFRPSTVSRRFSVTAGFCRTCVIDGLLEHSPAERVRRAARVADLRSHWREYRRPRRGTRSRGATRRRQGHQGRPGPVAAGVGRAIDRAVGARAHGPILLNSRGARMDHHAATRRLRRLAETAGVRITRPHPHMLRHTLVTTMLDAGVDLRDVQIAPAMPIRAPRCVMTGLVRTLTVTELHPGRLHGLRHLT